MVGELRVDKTGFAEEDWEGYAEKSKLFAFGDAAGDLEFGGKNDGMILYFKQRDIVARTG